MRSTECRFMFWFWWSSNPRLVTPCSHMTCATEIQRKQFERCEKDEEAASRSVYDIVLTGLRECTCANNTLFPRPFVHLSTVRHAVAYLRRASVRTVLISCRSPLCPRDDLRVVRGGEGEVVALSAAGVNATNGMPRER